MPDEPIEGQEPTEPTALPSTGDAMAAAMGEGGETPLEGAGEPPPEPLEAPQHWAAEHQTMFGTLPRDGQSFLLDRSKDMEAAHTRRSQEIAPFRQVSEQWAPYLGQLQATPAQMFNTLMQTEYQLRTGTNEQRMQILLGLARDYGVDFGGPPQPTKEEDPFGFQTMLGQRLGPIEQRLEQLGGGIQATQGAHQQVQVAAAGRTIEEFRGAKGADGKPAHPHFDEVADDILAMAQARSTAGQPIDIAKMYEAACWANPSVRAKLQVAERKSADAEQERRKKAALASGGLEGGGGGVTKGDQPKSTEEAMEKAYAALSA